MAICRDLSQSKFWLPSSCLNFQTLRTTFPFLESSFQIAAPSRELTGIMSLFQMEKTLLWTVCLVLLPKIYFKKRFYLLSKCLECFMLARWWVVLCCCKLYFIRNISYCDVNIKFLHPNGPATQFFKVYSGQDSTCWILIHHVITKVNPPSSGSTGPFY